MAETRSASLMNELFCRAAAAVLCRRRRPPKAGNSPPPLLPESPAGLSDTLQYLVLLTRRSGAVAQRRGCGVVFVFADRVEEVSQTTSSAGNCSISHKCASELASIVSLDTAIHTRQRCTESQPQHSVQFVCP